MDCARLKSGGIGSGAGLGQRPRSQLFPARYRNQKSLLLRFVAESEEMGRKLSKGLGIGPVQYNAVEPDAYRSFGFPGADEMGNMFQVYRDFESQVVGARSVEATRALHPGLQTFDQWIAANKDRIPV